MLRGMSDFHSSFVVVPLSSLSLYGHVALSLVGIVAGMVVVLGMLSAKPLPCWTKAFLITTVVTSATGFILPAQHFMPSHAVGIISLVVLAVAIFALYGRHLAGGWRKAYVISAITSLYLNVFVLIVQLFLKVPALKALAPTQTEPPFGIAQGATLLVFVLLGIGALRLFKVKEGSPGSVLLSERTEDSAESVARGLTWAMADMLDWDTKHPRAGMHLFRHEQELASEWLLQGGETGKVPKVDFTKEMVVAIFMDEGSYQKAPGIKRVEQRGSEIRIFYAVSGRGWTMINPCSVIKLPRADGAPVFVEISP